MSPTGYSSYEPGYLAAERPRWRWYHWLAAVVAALLPLAGGFAGARAFNTGIYKRGEMAKPDFAPPSWLFSPVWSVLYIMMGIASVLVVRFGGVGRDTAVPLLLYALQLLCDWAWTPLLFGAGLFSYALVDMALIAGLVAACVCTFYPVSKVAAAMMLPHLLWAAFATALNHDIVCLNGCRLNATEALNGTDAAVL